VTQQIDDRLAELETENRMLIDARQAVHTARHNEDVAYRRYSGKDFASDDLKGSASRMQSQSTIHNLLNALLYLPETEPMRRKAQVAVQLFKDLTSSSSVATRPFMQA